MPDSVVDAVGAAVKGEALVPAGEAAVTVARSVPHGHVAAAHAMARKLGLPALPGLAGRERDMAFALILSRAVHPGSALPTVAWWGDVRLGPDLGIGHAMTGEACAAMDWLQARQEPIETNLARRHPAPEANPSRMALSGLPSSWLEGPHCPRGMRGCSRDGTKGTVQIEYGLLTGPAGRPVAIRVLAGNAGDPAAFTQIAGVVTNTSGLKKMVMAGGRGMITSARIQALRDLGGDYPWITALRGPAIRKLMEDDGPLPLSLSGGQDLAEITSEDLLAATGKLLAPLTARVAAGRLAGAAEIGTTTGEILTKDKMAKHFDVTITATSLAAGREQAQIAGQARLDGIYVIRTPLPAAEPGAAATVTACTNLTNAERGFRHLTSGDLDLRPVVHRLGKRVRGHVLIGLLAACLTWHLHPARAPLTCTDQDPPAPADPAAPAERPAPAQARARRQHNEHGQARLSNQGLLDHLGTLTRNKPLHRHHHRGPRPDRPHQPAKTSTRPHRSRYPANPEQAARNRHQAQHESTSQPQPRHLQAP